MAVFRWDSSIPSPLNINSNRPYYAQLYTHDRRPIRAAIAMTYEGNGRSLVLENDDEVGGMKYENCDPIPDRRSATGYRVRDSVTIDRLYNCTHLVSEKVHKVGTALIEIAIVDSFRRRYQGRVSLDAVHNSHGFYWKLGFRPTNTSTEVFLAKLGKKIQTNVMLTEAESRFVQNKKTKIADEIPGSDSEMLQICSVSITEAMQMAFEQGIDMDKIMGSDRATDYGSYDMSLPTDAIVQWEERILFEPTVIGHSDVVIGELFIRKLQRDREPQRILDIIGEYCAV